MPGKAFLGRCRRARKPMTWGRGPLATDAFGAGAQSLPRGSPQCSACATALRKLCRFGGCLSMVELGHSHACTWILGNFQACIQIIGHSHACIESMGNSHACIQKMGAPPWLHKKRGGLQCLHTQQRETPTLACRERRTPMPAYNEWGTPMFT